MFTKYPQTEIKKAWPILKTAMLDNLPPTTNGMPVNLDFIFAKLMSDEMQLWIFPTDDMTASKGFIVTTFSSELGFNFSYLLIYIVVATVHITDAEWQECYDILRKFSKKYKCLKIIAFSANPRVIEITNQLGGDTSHHLITLEV